MTSKMAELVQPFDGGFGDGKFCPAFVNECEGVTIAAHFLLVAVAQCRLAEDERADAGLVHFDAFDAIGGDSALENRVLPQSRLVGANPLTGLKLIGFGIWERRIGSTRNVTFPARQYSVNGERRAFALLRPIVETAAQDRIRERILAAYDAYECETAGSR